MSASVTLTPATQVIVRDADAADAVIVFTELQRLYRERRGPAHGWPAVQFQDAIELVNVFEKLAAPVAVALAHDAPALWAAWRRAVGRVFEHVTNAPSLWQLIPDPAALWRGLLEPFAAQLAAFASRRPPFISP